MTGLRIEPHGPVLLLTLDRPEAHNALDAHLLSALREAVVGAARDPAVRAVVVTGSGEKAFSAGADLKELAGMGPDQAHRTLQAGQDTFRAIETAAVPVIAAVNGIALGGGFELALAATFPLLSTTSSLGLPEASLGLIPGYGGTQRLPRAIGSRAATHLMLTGDRLTPERAYALGLAPLPPIDPGALVGTALDVAAVVARRGPVAVRSILRAVHGGADNPVTVGLALETGLAALAVAGSESTEGIAAFLERRPAQFTDPQELT